MTAPPTIWKSAEAYYRAMYFYDQALACTGLPFNSFFVNTRFGQTHVLAFGQSDKPPVVIVPGVISGVGFSMYEVLRFLAEHYRVYTPDLVGGMGKSAPVRPNLQDYGYGYWLLDVLNALRLDRSAFISGESASWLLYKFTTIAPDRIARAVIINPFKFANTRYFSAIFTRQKAINALAKVQANPTEENAIAYINTALVPGTFLRPDVLRVEANIFLLAMTQYNTPDFNSLPLIPREELVMLKAPTLVLVGEQQKILNPAKIMETAKEYLPNLRSVQLIYGSCEAPTLEQPDWLKSRIHHFLQHLQ